MKFNLFFLTIDVRKHPEDNRKNLEVFDSYEQLMSNYKRYFPEDYPEKDWVFISEVEVLDSIEKKGGAMLAMNELARRGPNVFNTLLKDVIPDELPPHLLMVELVDME